MQVSHKLAEEVYKASAAKGQPGAGEAGPGTGNGHAEQASESSDAGKKNEGVIDAEFKVDDDKK